MRCFSPAGALLLALSASALGTTPASATPMAERMAPCLACHGAEGRSATEGVPSLGGQPADYLLTQLYQFREKLRIAPPMNEMAAGLSDDDLRNVSDALAALPAPQAAGPGDPARMERARQAAAKHQCGSCHSADYSGREQIPRLRAQREEYLAAALRGYKSNARPGYDPSMNAVAQELKDEEIADLAHFLAHQ